MNIRILLPGIALALLPQSALAQITVNLAAEGRPAAEMERDATSKPMEVLEWMGVEEGNVVLDIQSGGGYHMWIFSDAVGPGGQGLLAVVLPAGEPAGADRLGSDAGGERHVRVGDRRDP